MNHVIPSDIVVDLEKFPWPFKDNEADEIYCSHYFEHHRNQMAFMDECWRILKPGGKMELRGPYYTSVRAWQDPTHVRPFSEAMFCYYNKRWRKMNNIEHYPIKADFEIVEVKHIVDNEVLKDKTADEIRFMAKHYWNVVLDMEVILRKP